MAAGVAEAVEKATSQLLIMPDWDVNMQISDHAAASAAAAGAAMRAIAKKLGVRNPKVALLALTLADTCVKNGSAFVVEAAADRDLVASLSSFAKDGGGLGGEVQEKAADLLQLLGLGAAGQEHRLPFPALYHRLKGEGARFPAPDVPAVEALRATLAAPPPAPAPAAAAAAAAGPSTGAAAAPAAGDRSRGPAAPATSAAAAADPAAVAAALASALHKLRGDLLAVRARIALTARMLVDGAAASPASAPFLDAVDFLAQASPRLQALVEACAAGVIADEAAFDACLGTAEAAARVLEHAAPIAALAAPGREAAAAAFSPAPCAAVADLVDMDAEAEGEGEGETGAEGRGVTHPPADAAAEGRRPVAAVAAKPAAAAAADDDLLGLFAAGPAPSVAPAAAAAASAARPVSAGGGGRASLGGAGGIAAPAASGGGVAAPSPGQAPTLLGAADAAAAPAGAVSLASFEHSGTSAAAAAPNPFEDFSSAAPSGTAAGSLAQSSAPSGLSDSDPFASLPASRPAAGEGDLFAAPAAPGSAGKAPAAAAAGAPAAASASSSSGGDADSVLRDLDSLLA